MSLAKLRCTQEYKLGEETIIHLSYTQPDPSLMVLIASYSSGQTQRFEYLHPDAAKALKKMISAARDDRIWIVPISAFRSLERQKKLFEKAITRRGSEEQAARFSAPPSFSEHHTGYAVDLGDGHSPNLDFSTDFSKTPAFIWLNQHATDFGFEMSFPPDNSQGISYEPWHWRYIESQEANEVFSKAQNLEK